jgi:hypothetical protein
MPLAWCGCAVNVHLQGNALINGVFAEVSERFQLTLLDVKGEAVQLGVLQLQHSEATFISCIQDNASMRKSNYSSASADWHFCLALKKEVRA